MYNVNGFVAESTRVHCRNDASRHANSETVLRDVSGFVDVLFVRKDF